MNEARHIEAFDQKVSGKWGMLTGFLAFSALEIWVLLSGDVTFAHWKDWLVAFGAVLFPFMALWSAVELTKDHRVTGVARYLAITFKWVLALPFVIAAVALVGWFLYQIFGWFGTIPSWAAVIIVLLLINYGRREPRA